MAVTATFLADFTTFQAAVDRATVKLKGLETGGTRVEKALTRMGDSFSGRRIVQDANLAVRAIEQMGGATVLTAKEQQRLNVMLTEALAKYKALGQQAPASLVAMADATRKVEQQMTLTQRVAASFSGTLGQVAAGFTLGAFATRGVSALSNFASSLVTTAGALTDASQKTGLTTDTLQQMSFAAEQAGGTLEDFTNASFKLGVNLAGGGKSVKTAVDALGLSLEELSRLTPDQQFTRIAQALGQVEDSTERNRLGVLLFGKSFGQIAAVVADGWDEIADGATIAGAAQVKAIDDATDATVRFGKALQSGGINLLGKILLGVERPAMALAQSFESIASRARAVGEGIKAVGVESAAAMQSYAEQLNAATLEAQSLTKAQRDELNAALELGAKSAQELEEEFFKVEGALKIYQEQQRLAAKATDDQAEAMRKATEEAKKLEAATRAVVTGWAAMWSAPQMLNPQQDRDVPSGPVDIPGWAGMWSAPAVLESQQHYIASVQKTAKEATTIWQDAMDSMETYTVDAFADMLTGVRSFRDGVMDIWRGIQRSISDYISSIVRQWLAGMGVMGQSSQGVAGAVMGGGGAMVGGGPGGSLMVGSGGMRSAASGGGGGMFAGYNQAVGPWARYGSGAVVGGIAGFSAGYSTGSRTQGVIAGASAGALAGMGGGVYGIAIGAGVGAAAGLFGAQLGQNANAAQVAAARRAWLEQFGPNGGYQIQQALGIFGTGNNNSDGLRLWRDFNNARDFDTLNRTGSQIQSYMNVFAQGPAPDMRRPTGSINGIPTYGNEAFNLTTPHLAVVGDANEPEHVLKDSTLRKVARGGDSVLRSEVAGLRAELERRDQRFERYLSESPLMHARALRDALILAGVRA